MDIGRLRILECRVIRGRDINLAISSLIRGETYYLQISLQKLFHQHLKLAFGQSQKEYKEKRLIPRAGPYCSFMSNPKLTLLTETGSLKTGSVKDDFSVCLISVQWLYTCSIGGGLKGLSNSTVKESASESCKRRIG